MADIIGFPDRMPQQHVVLLVDDEYLMRGVLSEILREAGFYVVVAVSGEQAINYLNQLAHIDAVFSDIKMPGMDGFKLAKWIARNRPDVPVVLASGYAGKTDMANDLSGAHFMSKPFGFDEIVAKLNALVSQKRRLNS